MRTCLSGRTVCLLAICALSCIAVLWACAPRRTNDQVRLAQGAKVVVSPYEGKEQSSTTRTLKHKPEPPKSPVPSEPIDTRGHAVSPRIVTPAKPADQSVSQQNTAAPMRDRQSTGGRSIRNSDGSSGNYGGASVRNTRPHRERTTPTPNARPVVKPRSPASTTQRTAPRARSGAAR